MKYFNFFFVILILFNVVFISCSKLEENAGLTKNDSSDSTYNILDYGAIGDSSTMNTSSIQEAIDVCHQNGGGTVLIPAGHYVTNTIFLKDSVELHLDEGAVLWGDTILNNYPDIPGAKSPNSVRAVVAASFATNISITGNGTINGRGGATQFLLGNSARWRPYLIYFTRCNNVEVEGVSLLDAAFWVQLYEECQNMVISNLFVKSHVNWNNDGMDLDNCKNVVVENCYFDVDDDAFCLKSEANTAGVCENIIARNCVFRTNCNAIKTGTSSHGGFKNILVENCTVKEASEDNFRFWQSKLSFITAPRTVLSGIAIEAVDGAEVEGVTIKNIHMENVQTPIFIKVGDRNRHAGKISKIDSIVIDSVYAEVQSRMASSITAFPGQYVENVTIRNIDLVLPGGGTQAQADASVPENEKNYPENYMFGHSLPSTGFYIRHAQNVIFENVNFTTSTDEIRPMYKFDDVIGARVASSSNLTDPPIWQRFIRIVNTKDLIVENCDLLFPIRVFLKLEGNSGIENIQLTNNDLSKIQISIVEGDQNLIDNEVTIN